MKAIRLHGHTAPAVFAYEEAPRPQPRDGEVLIRVHAAAVTPTELRWAPTSMTRTGEPRPLPLILGHEFSGTMDAVGPGVGRLAAGRRGLRAQRLVPDGAEAEYCVARAGSRAQAGDPLDHVHAAVVPISALTAWQGLFERARLERGQRVLIHGGAGAVGIFAVQLARWRGAQVITTVSAHISISCAPSGPMQ